MDGFMFSLNWFVVYVERFYGWMLRFRDDDGSTHYFVWSSFSVQQLAVDDVVSRCATVLGEWVIYGVVRKTKKNKRKNHHPSGGTCKRRSPRSGSTQPAPRWRRGSFPFAFSRRTGLELFRTSSHLASLKKEPVAKLWTALCAAAQHVQKTLQAEGGGVVKSTQQVCAPKKKNLHQLARMKMSQVERERWEQTHTPSFSDRAKWCSDAGDKARKRLSTSAQTVPTGWR